MAKKWASRQVNK